MASGPQIYDLLHRKETSLTDTIRLASPPHGNPRRYLSFSREIAWIGGGQAASVLAALVGLTWLTRFLSPGEYGQLALMLSLANLVGLVMFGPLAAAAGRFLETARERGEHSALLHATARLIAYRGRLFGVGSAVVAILCAAAGFRHAAAFILLASLFAFVWSMTTTFEAILNAGRLRREVAVHRAMQQILNYGLALALVAAWRHSALVAMLGFVAGAAVTAMSEARVLNARVWRSPRDQANSDSIEEWCARMRAYARPYERWGGPQWLQAASDRWTLLLASGTHDAGLYAVVYQLGYTPLGLLANLLVQTIEPIAFARAGDASTSERLPHAQRLRRTALALFSATAAIAVVIAALLHGFAFRVLVDPAYWPVSPLLPWMALAAGLVGAAQLQAVKWLILLRPERMEKRRILLSAVGVVLIAAGAVIAGPAGVAAAQVVFSLLFLAGMLALR